MRVILATDGSSYARLAEEILLRVPLLRGAEILVVSVAATPHVPLAGMPSFESAAMAEELAQLSEDSRTSARDSAESCVARLKSEGVNAVGFTLDGEPGNEILEFSATEGASHIVIGSRGLGGLKSLFLGSVARKLVNSAEASVLVVRAAGGKTPDEDLDRVKGLKKLDVVVGFDGTDGAAAAAKVVNASGKGAFGRVTVVCAEPLSVMPAGIDPGTFGELYRYDHERAVEVARHGAATLAGVGDSVESATGLGRPSRVLTDAATEREAELVVLGATRHGTLERFLIGSVSYEVAVSAPCSVWVVRPPRE